MRLNICVSVFALGYALAACTSDSTTLTVENHSDFAIVDIRLTEVDNPSFGPNLIDGDVLLPGEALTLDTDCGTFDARVTDETGARCDLFDIDLCLNDATWVLTNTDCPVFSVAAKKAEAAAKSSSLTKQ